MPILARQDSLLYTAGKFVRRHRLLLAATAMVIVSLLSGVVIAWSQARQAERSRHLAEALRRKAESERVQADVARRSAEREHESANLQRVRAEVEAQNARTEQQRAEQRLTQMVELANRSLFDVHSAIERLSGATPARQEIVKTTVAFLENISKDASRDDRLRLALSTAYYRLGDIQGYQFTPNLGDTAGALKSYRAAATLIEPLRVKQPRDPDTLLRWVDIQNRIGSVQDASGESARSAKTYRDALPAATQLARLRPSEAGAVAREAKLYQDLASALKYTDPAEAIEYLRKSLAILTKLASTHPDNSEILDMLSGAHAVLGLILQRRDDLAGARDEYDKCIAIREKLVAAHPNDVVSRRLLMIAYGHIGNVLGIPFIPNLGDSQGASEYYRKAVAIARDISRGDPQDRTAQYDLASSLLRLGAIDVPAAGISESLAILQQAGDILSGLSKMDPKAIRYKRSIGIVHEYTGHRLRDLGRLADAMSEYQRSLAAAEDALAMSSGDLPSHSQALAAERAIANVLAEQGDRAGAIGYAAKALERTERYSYGPDREPRQMYLALGYFAMASVRRTLGDWPEARIAADLAVTEWRALIAGRRNHPNSADLTRAENLLRDCQSHLK
jgi:serine/threonine-protein kinase